MFLSIMSRNFLNSRNTTQIMSFVRKCLYEIGQLYTHVRSFSVQDVSFLSKDQEDAILSVNPSTASLLG